MSEDHKEIWLDCKCSEGSYEGREWCPYDVFDSSDHEEGCAGSVRYVRADLHEAAIRERDEARTEIERLKTYIANNVSLSKAEAEARGYEGGVREAAKVAQKHLAYVPNHHPDEPMEDLVAQGYGNAALNIEHAILALLEKPTETKQP
jgi:hypothetical protein